MVCPAFHVKHGTHFYSLLFLFTARLLTLVAALFLHFGGFLGLLQRLFLEGWQTGLGSAGVLMNMITLFLRFGGRRSRSREDVDLPDGTQQIADVVGEREDIVVHYLVHDDAIIDDSAAMRGRRVGLAVSKAVGNAVTRHAVKRRFRVLARKYEAALPESCDIVLRAKPSAPHADFLSLEQQIAACFEAVNRKAVRR